METVYNLSSCFQLFSHMLLTIAYENRLYLIRKHFDFTLHFVIYIVITLYDKTLYALA